MTMATKQEGGADARAALEGTRGTGGRRVSEYEKRFGTLNIDLAGGEARK